MTKLVLKYLYVLTIVIPLITTLESCHKEDASPKDLGFFALGEAKDYVYFKPGTWWVYRNTRTKLNDTIRVTYSLLDTLEETSEKWHFTNELFYVHSVSQTNGDNYYFWERSATAETIYQPSGSLIPTMERDNPYQGELRPFYYPFDRLKNNPNGGYDTYCTTVKDTLTINNKLYHKVAIFYIKNDNIEPNPLDGHPAKYYWAKNFGLVQKDLFDNKFRGDTGILYHSWELINSNIIQ